MTDTTLTPKILVEADKRRQVDALATINRQLQQSHLHISDAFIELQQRWSALVEHYEGQGAEEAGMAFQTIAHWQTDFLEQVEQLQKNVADQELGLKTARESESLCSQDG